MNVRALCLIQHAALVANMLLLGLVSANSQEPSRNNEKELPAVVDLRTTFSELGLKQRQQGARGTCSVFTIVGGLEFAIARSQGRGETLSVDFLNWAANQHRAPRDGGFFSDMWKGFSEHGICDEEQMPYLNKFDSSRAPDSAAIARAKTRLELNLTRHWIKEWNVKTGLTDAQFLAIKQTLNQGWPVCGGFRWPKKPIWKEHALQMCPPEDVFDGHSVLIVGYRDEPSEDGGGVLIFRNSNGGGTDSFMSYAYARAYMNDALWISAPVKSAASVDTSHSDNHPRL
jgi:Papain family cysteine protease